MSALGGDPVTSMLKTGWNLTQKEEIPKTVAKAGKFLIENLPPTVQFDQSAPMRSVNQIGMVMGLGSSLSLPALGLGLTAGVVKLGLDLLHKRLNSKENSHRSGRIKESKAKDPLRKLNSKSRNLGKTKSDKSKSSCSQSSNNKERNTSNSPLKELGLLFPNLERSLLGDMLANNEGHLEETIDQLLSFNIDYTPTPSVSSQSNSFKFQPSSSEARHKKVNLPQCPDCPVCLTALVNKRIYQCVNGHHICQQCKQNPSLKACPTCRQKIVGRATNMEQFLVSIYN